MDIGRNPCVRKGSGSLSAQISEGKGRRLPMTVGVRKLESWPGLCLHDATFSRFGTIPACGRTDEHTDDS